jgi:hypothetical protein
MKYITLALVVLGLYACSPNPNYVPPAQTPAQHELAQHKPSCNAALDIWGLDPACKPAPPIVLDNSRDAPPSNIEFIKPLKNTSFFILTAPSAREIVRVESSGRIYLRGKEVHTDAQYRAAIKAIMLGAMGCTNEKQLEDATHVEE